MFIEIESGELINLDLVDNVQLWHHRKMSTLRSGDKAWESSVAYQYFKDHPELIVNQVSWPVEAAV